MMSRVTDMDVAAAVRLAGRAEEIASQAEQDCAFAEIYPIPYAAALAAVLRHLMGTGDAETLQVAVSEFDYREAQAQQEEEYHQQRWQAEHDEKTRRHELALQVACPVCGAVPGDPCRTTGPTGPKAKGLDDHKARYRAATSEAALGDNSISQSPGCSLLTAPPPTSTCRNSRTGTARPGRSRRPGPGSGPGWPSPRSRQPTLTPGSTITTLAEHDRRQRDDRSRGQAPARTPKCPVQALGGWRRPPH